MIEELTKALVRLNNNYEDISGNTDITKEELKLDGALAKYISTCIEAFDLSILNSDVAIMQEDIDYLNSLHPQMDK